MNFVVRELSDLAPVHGALVALSRVNSAHVDIEAEARLPHARFWVASPTSGDEPVAYVLLWLVGDEIEIIDVATAVTQRRRGAARALLSTLLDAYGSAGRKAAFLEVRAGNEAAIGLYLGLGFERTRVRRGYYSNGEDAHEMYLALPRASVSPQTTEPAANPPSVTASNGAKP